MAAANLYRGALCVGGLGVATFFVGNVEKADSECETKGLLILAAHTAI